MATSATTRSGASPLTVNFAAIGAGESTITAIAVRDNFSDSEPASASFTVSNPPAATPTFSLADGDVSYNSSVTIRSDGARIYYTTGVGNPSTPNMPNMATSATTRSGASPLTVNFAGIGAGESTITAIAVKSNFSDSAPASATFTIAPENDVDADNNGLIEISNLDMLNNIRWNLAGTNLRR